MITRDIGGVIYKTIKLSGRVSCLCAFGLWLHMWLVVINTIDWYPFIKKICIVCNFSYPFSTQDELFINKCSQIDRLYTHPTEFGNSQDFVNWRSITSFKTEIIFRLQIIVGISRKVAFALRARKTKTRLMVVRKGLSILRKTEPELSL